MLLTDNAGFRWYVWDRQKGDYPPAGAAYAYLVTPKGQIYIWGRYVHASFAVDKYWDPWAEASGKYFHEDELLVAGFKQISYQDAPTVPADPNCVVAYLPSYQLSQLAKRNKVCL